MALVSRVFLLAALAVGIAGPAAAATIGIAWDASSDAALVGYRVFVGTSPGDHGESFDLGRFQTSFYYARAVAGRRYYFAVSTMVQGAISGKSAEVSAVAAERSAATATVPVAPGLTQRSEAPTDVKARAVGVAPLSAVSEIASGLDEITSMALTPASGGLLVQHGTRVHTFSDRGLGDLAHEVVARTRIAAVAVDPQFDNTGLVYVAEARQGPADEDVWVVRHRLIAGVFGESAAIVSAGRQPVGTSTGLVIASNGDIVLAQQQRVTRFRQDGSVVRSQPMALGAPHTGPTSALAWDGQREGVWAVRLGTASVLEVSFLPLQGNGVTARAATVHHGDGSLVGDGSGVAAGVAVLDGAVTLTVASDSTVSRFDLGTSTLSAGTSVTGLGTVVSVMVAEPSVDVVVVRGPVASTAGHASYSLLRVRHAAVP